MYSYEYLSTQIVKVVYPLKQGLKRPRMGDETTVSEEVKVVYPLKQGLKRKISFG